MKQKDMVMKSQIDTFKQKSLLFLLATITKSFEKTKLGSPIMHYTSCLTPSHLITLASSKSFKLLINWFVFRNILPCKIGDKALSQFFGSVFNWKSKTQKLRTHRLLPSIQKKQRIDDFLKKKKENEMSLVSKGMTMKWKST